MFPVNLPGIDANHRNCRSYLSYRTILVLLFCEIFPGHSGSFTPRPRYQRHNRNAHSIYVQESNRRTRARCGKLKHLPRGGPNNVAAPVVNQVMSLGSGLKEKWKFSRVFKHAGKTPEKLWSYSARGHTDGIC